MSFQVKLTLTTYNCSCGIAAREALLTVRSCTSRTSPSRIVSARSRGATLYGVFASSALTSALDSENSTPRSYVRFLKIGTATVRTSCRYSELHWYQELACGAEPFRPDPQP